MELCRTGSLNACRASLWEQRFSVHGFAVKFIQECGDDAVGEVKGRGGLGRDTQVVIGQAAPEKGAKPVGQLLSAAFPQDRANGTDKSSPFHFGCVGNCQVHPSRTLSFDRLWYLSVEAGCGCAGAGAEGEYVCVGEANLFDVAQTFFKVGLRFTGKADDEIGGDDKIGDGYAGAGHEFTEAVDGTAAGHAAQLGVGAGLEWQVQMGAEPTGPALPEVKEAVGQFPGLETAEAQAGDVGMGEDGCGQLLEIGAPAPLQVPAVCSEVDTREDGFAEAALHKGLHFLDHVGGRTAAAVAAQGSDDTECATVLAAVLDLDECASAAALLFGGRGRERGAVRLNADQILGIGELCAPWLKERVQHFLGMVVCHKFDAGKGGALLGGQGWRSSR